VAHAYLRYAIHPGIASKSGRINASPRVLRVHSSYVMDINEASMPSRPPNVPFQVSLVGDKPSFMDFPWEIRDAVYSALLEHDEPVPLDLPLQDTCRPVIRPELASSGMLRCNRQVHQELVEKMRLWQDKGFNTYKLHAVLNNENPATRFWRRIPVPLRYIHTFEIDLVNWQFDISTQVHGLIRDFLEYGPELASLPCSSRSWPLIDTVIINLPSSEPKKLSVRQVTIEDIHSAPVSDTFKYHADDILHSLHFEEMRAFLGYYIRVVQVRCEGYICQRLVEPVLASRDIHLLQSEDI
jgi:hypothetical protein